MKIDIVGAGNVGWHLYRCFATKTDCKLINSRDLKGLRTDADLVLIAVSDKAISEIVRKMNDIIPSETVVAHTSGSTPLKVVSAYFIKSGVFYPLQTFTKGVEMDYSEIPLFLEFSCKKAHEILSNAALLMSDKIRIADSDKRKKIHIASVLACNFVNHLWTLSQDYMEENAIDFEDIKPLILKTTDKLRYLSPVEAQTGPAVRNDLNTIKSHLEMLASNSKLEEIYKLISDSIINRHYPDHA